MTIEIICPICGFINHISEDKIRAKTHWVTCPNCDNSSEIPIHNKEKTHAIKQGKLNVNTYTDTESPWEDKNKRGVFQKIFRTFWLVIFSPNIFFRNMAHQKTGLIEPFAFGLLMGSIGLILRTFWEFLITPQEIIALSPKLIDSSLLNLLFYIFVILSPVFVAINIFVTAGILHLCLLITGAAKGGFEGTFRVIAYSQAIQLLTALPIISGVTGFLYLTGLIGWRLIIQIIGQKEIHRSSYLRIIAGFIIPFVLFILLTALIIALFFYV